MLKAIIVCGSRNWSDRNIVFAALDPAEAGVVIHGACPSGADRFAAEWCADSCKEQCYVAEVPMPAQWDRFGSRAGPVRNLDMLAVLQRLQDCGYECCVHAFPLGESRGTRHMIGIAQDAGFKVHVY